MTILSRKNVGTLVLTIPCDDNDTILNKEELGKALEYLFQQSHVDWTDEELLELAQEMIWKASIEGNRTEDWDQKPTVAERAAQNFDEQAIDEVVERAARTLL